MLWFCEKCLFHLPLPSENIRHGLDERSMRDKELERLSRAYARAVSKLHSVKNLIPPLYIEEEDLKKDKIARDADCEKQETLLGEIKQEIEVFVGAHLRQENIEQDRKDELVRIVRTIADMRNALVDLKKQNADWAKHLVFLEQARNKLQRDLMAAARSS